jgi:hypothetical protein
MTTTKGLHPPSDDDSHEAACFASHDAAGGIDSPAFRRRCSSSAATTRTAQLAEAVLQDSDGHKLRRHGAEVPECLKLEKGRLQSVGDGQATRTHRRTPASFR